MGPSILNQIVHLLGSLLAFVVVLRFLLQASHADFYNPISQGIFKLTQPVIGPMQRVIPKFGRFDLSALLAGYAVVMVTIFILAGFSNPLAVVLASLLDGQLGLISIILNIYFFAVLGSVIISWVAPNSYHPGPQLISQLTEPVFSLARKVIPPIGGLDLSPILIFLIISVVKSQLPMMLR